MIPNDVYRAWVEAGNDWADKHGAAELLEGSLKSLKAQLTMEMRRELKCSMAEATEVALTCADYRDAFAASVEARRQANRARVGYEAIKALFEAQRTVEATSRAAMRSET